MVVCGFEMPEAFMQLFDAIQRGEAPTSWVPKDREEDDVEALLFIADPERMRSATELHRSFSPELDQDTSAIEDTGVENVVWFARSRTGRSYLFDFGADPKEPSVISFDEGVWAREAPDFTSFMALYVPKDLEPVGRDTLRSWALRSVLTPEEMVPVALELLPMVYANLRPAERRKVETEVRVELERQGMSDAQRRRLDELWERLRATDQA